MAHPGSAERHKLIKICKDNGTGNEVAHKAQRNSQRRAAANAYITLLAENARNADNRVCHDVIEQNRADESRRRHAPAEDAVHRDAERKLNDGFHKGSRKAPLKAVHDGNHGARAAWKAA